jgi:hypothetical protein
MKKKPRKPWSTLKEDLKQIRKRAPKSELIEDYNKLKQEDEKREKDKSTPDSEEKKIASGSRGALL